MSPLERIVSLERQLRSDVAALGTQPRWLPGRWSRSAREQSLLDAFHVARDAAVTEYRRGWMAAELARAARRAAHLCSAAGVVRDWLPALAERPERVLAELPDADLVRRFDAVQEADVLAYLAAEQDRRARISETAPLVTPPASTDVPLNRLHSPAGEVRPAGLDGRPLDEGTSVLRYRVGGDEGIVEKIRVDQDWQGLGLATAMLEAMMAAHPLVRTWWTSPQSEDGAALFGRVRARHPRHGWQHHSSPTVFTTDPADEPAGKAASDGRA